MHSQYLGAFFKLIEIDLCKGLTRALHFQLYSECHNNANPKVICANDTSGFFFIYRLGACPIFVWRAGRFGSFDTFVPSVRFDVAANGVCVRLNERGGKIRDEINFDLDTGRDMRDIDVLTEQGHASITSDNARGLQAKDIPR